MRPSRVLVLVLAVLGGCYPPPPVYRVQRAARVPRPTVPLRTGQPLAGPIELTLGASSLGQTRTPAAGTQKESLELPDHQVRGELRLRIGTRGEIAAIHERAVGHATKLDPTQADVDSGQPWGAGAAVRYAIHPDGEPWSVGLDLELLRWMVPFREERVCVENCEGVATYQSIRSRSAEATWGFGIIPAYRFGRVSLFGGVFLRNHPTIVRKGTEYTEANDADTNGGPVNLLVHAGAAVQLGAVTALVLVHHNTDRDPVSYGPGIGLALSASIDPGAIAARGGGEPTKLERARARWRARAQRADAR